MTEDVIKLSGLPSSSMNAVNEVTDLRSKLNSKSEDLDTAITTINTSLAKLGIDTDVWLASDDDENLLDIDTWGLDDESENPCRVVTVLGYARAEDAWQLAWRIEVQEKRRSRDGDEYVEVVEEKESRSLVNADKSLRLKAAKQIPKLVAGILLDTKDDLKRRLAGIEATERVAAQLTSKQLTAAKLPPKKSNFTQN